MLHDKYHLLGQDLKLHPDHSLIILLKEDRLTHDEILPKGLLNDHVNKKSS